MTPLQTQLALAAAGFAIGTFGAFGRRLLDGFAGRPLEVMCRRMKRRERFRSILQFQDDTIRGGEYLQLIGTVIYLMFGTLAWVRFGTLNDWSLGSPQGLIGWIVIAILSLLAIHYWLPITLTRFASTPLLYYTWPTWRVMAALMNPLAIPGDLLQHLSRRIAGTIETEAEEEEQSLEDEIRTIVTAGTQQGYFGPGVREMIQGVMDMHDDTVGHIMTSRSSVDAIDTSDDWPSVLAKIVDSRRTRYPVYKQTLDNIVGVLYAKDLLKHLAAGNLESYTVEDLGRRPWTVPKDRSVESLLREFLHNRSHMAIVVDEFGQTAGVVTIEDTLEEIVGEIFDESDDQEVEVKIVMIDDETYEVDGRVMIDDLNEQTHWQLPESDDYQTVAGWLLHQTGAMPKEGEHLSVGGMEIDVTAASDRKVNRVRLHRPPAA